MSRPDSVEIIGVPLDLGANIRGSLMGPASLRIAGISEKLGQLGFRTVEAGDVSVPVREALTKGDRQDGYVPAIHSVCTAIAGRVHQALGAGHLPLTLGGDHSLAIGSIGGVYKHFNEKNQDFGLIWIDAHADLNTMATSPSGNIHGMPLSILLGHHPGVFADVGGKGPKISPEKTALVGIRSVDDKEKAMLSNSGIRYFTMREIDERGMGSVMEEALTLASKGSSGIHVSFDIDGVDPLFAPGVSTPENGGLTYREAHLAMEMIADTHRLTSIDMVELNPLNDHECKSAHLAVELIQSALGKAIDR